MGRLESEYDVEDPDVVSVIDDAPLWSAPFGLRLLEVVRMRKNIRALDVGSGLGFPLVELAQRLGPTCKVYGIDPWTPANERARMKVRVWARTTSTTKQQLSARCPASPSRTLSSCSP
jgi:SAM-dependent methyltransferase